MSVHLSIMLRGNQYALVWANRGIFLTVGDKDMYDKNTRILYMLERLLQRSEVTKDEIQEMFGVDSRTFERDIATLRAYFSQRVGGLGDQCIEYDHQKKKYYLKKSVKQPLDVKQVLVLIKLLLGTRSLSVDELDQMIDSLCAVLDEEDSKMVQAFISNERLHFTPLKHEQQLIDRIWSFSHLIDSSHKMTIEYKKANNTVSTYMVAPVGLLFCDFYFYVVCYVTDRDIPYPISFRVDRILSYAVLKESFKIPYAHRFESGDFRNKINMMYQGELIKFTFRFTGHSVEAVLDKFPISRVIEEGNGYCIIEAMAYEQGLLMWIFSQGDWIHLLTPQDLVEKAKARLDRMQSYYKRLEA